MSQQGREDERVREKEAKGLAPLVWKNLAHGAELLCVGCHHLRIHLASKNKMIYPSVSRCSASAKQLSSMVGLKMSIEPHYQHILLKTLRCSNCGEQLLFCNTDVLYEKQVFWAAKRKRCHNSEHTRSILVLSGIPALLKIRIEMEKSSNSQSNTGIYII